MLYRLEINNLEWDKYSYFGFHNTMKMLEQK